MEPNYQEQQTEINYSTYSKNATHPRLCELLNNEFHNSASTNWTIINGNSAPLPGDSYNEIVYSKQNQIPYRSQAIETNLGHLSNQILL